MNAALKTCLSCGESVQQDFDFCPYCSYLFPKSTWQTHKNTIAITALSGTVIFLGGLLLLGPSGTVPTPQASPVPVPTVTASVRPSIEPSLAKLDIPKPIPTTTVIQSKISTPAPVPKSTPEIDLQIKGNRNSGIYHLPQCASYGSISPRNVVWFKTEEEAKAAGFRRAKNC